MSRLVIDLFAGAGGWDVGLRELGVEPVGFEKDRDACATRRAAGMLTVRADLESYPPTGRPDGIVASPPCQSFSRAGKRQGLADPRGRLVIVPLRWVLALRPRWTAWEQVPDVLPIWEQHGVELRAAGYSVWTGLLSAETFGVPQTRERAYLLARADGAPALPPPPSHQEYRPGVPRWVEPEGDLFGGVRLPWVSMSDALGWSPSTVAYHRHRAPALGERRNHPAGEPAPTLTQKARCDSWVVRTGNNSRRRGGDTDDWRATHARFERTTDAPAPTLETGSGTKWTLHRPATTVVGEFRPDVIAAPGYRVATSRQNAEGSVRVTVAEAAILQGFPADFAWQGSRTAQFRQVGNAVAPPVARAICGQFLAHVAEPADA